MRATAAPGGATVGAVSPTLIVLFWWLAFAGSHWLLSSVSVRQRLIAVLGDWPFRGLYSIVAFATFIPLVAAYFAHQHSGPWLWQIPLTMPVLWLIYLGMTVAFILLAAAFMRPSPGSVIPGAAAPRGAFRLARHPLFTAFALMGLVHLIANGSATDVVFFGGLAVYSLAGAWHQDQRKLALDTPGYRAFYEATPLLPFSRPGRLQGLREMGPVPLVVGIGLTVLGALLPRRLVRRVIAQPGLDEPGDRFWKNAVTAARCSGVPISAAKAARSRLLATLAAPALIATICTHPGLPVVSPQSIRRARRTGCRASTPAASPPRTTTATASPSTDRGARLRIGRAAVRRAPARTALARVGRVPRCASNTDPCRSARLATGAAPRRDPFPTGPPRPTHRDSGESAAGMGSRLRPLEKAKRDRGTAWQVRADLRTHGAPGSDGRTTEGSGRGVQPRWRFHIPPGLGRAAAWAPDHRGGPPWREAGARVTRPAALRRRSSRAPARGQALTSMASVCVAVISGQTWERRHRAAAPDRRM